MSQTGWMLAAVGLAGATAALWPAHPGGNLWLSAYRRPGRAEAWWVCLPALAAGAAAAVPLGAPTGISIGLLAGVCAASGRVIAAGRRAVRNAEAMSRLTAVLANQAMVSSTVVEALSRSAPLITGPVGRAAGRLAEECAAGEVAAAADAFVRAVPAASAVWLADIVSITASGGGRVGDALAALETRAGEHAATVRLSHSKVSALLPQLMAVVALGAGMVAAVAAAADDVASWLSSPQGQLVTLLSAGLTALLSSRILLPAWNGVR